ncbi:hypothetical protein [uncultured Oscillibacter sp.]|uniref:hypothetical protein n=1 Tax=uncultured Oscillibacter sp. TaxID=876091 RepID=UPI0025F9518D|nr:hypothetical protein [uncultured Oscillibacter sp.]
MDEELLAAVRGSRVWLKNFQRREYRDAFRSYTERFGPPYMAEAERRGEAGLPALAEELLDALEAGWKRSRLWDRGALRAGEKQMVVVYLTPMLLGLESPGCRRLAELLQAAWQERWPRDGYRTASYEEIQSGFRNTIMGFEIR